MKNFFSWLIRLLFVKRKTYSANVMYEGKLCGSVWVCGRFYNMADAYDDLLKLKEARNAVLVDLKRIE